MAEWPQKTCFSPKRVTTPNLVVLRQRVRAEVEVPQNRGPAPWHGGGVALQTSPAPHGAAEFGSTIHAEFDRCLVKRHGRRYGDQPKNLGPRVPPFKVIQVHPI